MRNRTIHQVRTGSYHRIVPLTLRIAADVLGRPITVIGPDAASSAAYGQDLPGDPIELIPLAGGAGFARYLVAEPLADGETGVPDLLLAVLAPTESPEAESPDILAGSQVRARLHARVLRYLAEPSAPQDEIDLLTDVLGEAEGWVVGAPAQRISAGLALLPANPGGQSFTAELPGITPAELEQGARITVPGLIRAHKNLESVTSGDVLYVIEEGDHGRDVSRLAERDLIMFDRGQHFEVVRVGEEGRRRRIVLRPPRDGDRGPDATAVRSTATDPPGDAHPEEALPPPEEYLAGSGLVLPEGMSRADAVAALRLVAERAVAERAGYRAEQAAPGPRADSVLRQGLRLLGGYVGLRVYASVPAEALTTPTDDGEPLYRQGRVIEAAGLTVGLAEPGGVPAGHVRVVIFPRPAGGGSGARDAGWLLGAGVVVFGPGTRFEVAAVDAAHGELSWRELADAAAPVLAPEVAGQPLTAAPFGLARPEVMVTYADEIARLAGVWERLWEPERVYALQIAINAALARIGVPPVRVTAARAGRIPSLFSVPEWEVLLARDDLADLWHMAMAVYREARHAEQMFLMMRLPAGQAAAASVPEVAGAARQQGMLAEGSPEYAAVRGWWDSLHGTEAVAVEASVRGPLRQAVEDVERWLWEFGDRLSAELELISDPEAREQRAEDAQAALAPYEGEVAAARDDYEHRVMRRYRDLPAEFDAFMLQARVQHGLNPGAVPVEDHRYLPPGQAPLLRYSRAVSYRVHHLWVGLRPSPVVEALLPAPLGNGVVIHGWGDAGRLVADGGVDLARVSLPRTDVVVLAHDAHLDVQDLATARGRPVWAPGAPVWVSLGTGAVFLGEAQVSQDGLLQPAHDGPTAGQLVKYAPHGSGQPVPLAAGERPPVLRLLTPVQAAADPGPWQLRGSDRRQPLPPTGGPRQEDAEAFGEDLSDREQAEAEDAALEDRRRRAAEELAATWRRVPGGMVSAGLRWHSRFGEVIAAARPEPGQCVLGLEVGPEGRLALWDGGDVYTDLDAEAVEGLRDHGWAGENLLIITERRPFDEVDEQLGELAGALGVSISVDPRSALPGTDPDTGMVTAGPPGESRFGEVTGAAEPEPDYVELSESAEPGDVVAVRSVAGTGADVRVVVWPAQDGGVDLGPFRELLRKERVLGLVEAFLGLEPRTLIDAVIGARPPVRIVVAAMPAGAAGDAVIRRLWDEFAGSARVAFAPAPGHRVVAGDGDLAVVDGSGQPGWWVQVGSGLPGRYLGRDLMNPDVEVIEDELVLWMVRDSAVPGLA